MFELRLDEDIFEIVKKGTKRVEIRLYDEKRKSMKIGDKLTFFKRPLLDEKIDTTISKHMEDFYLISDEAYGDQPLYLSRYKN